MDRDLIARVEIDGEGRLHVVPTNQEFPLIYRAGMEVSWDQNLRSLHSPKPRDWSYTRWFGQILAAAAQEYGYELYVTHDTTWVNIDLGTKAQLLSASRYGA
jgi:hypothetical protein